MHILKFFVGKREKNATKNSVNMNIDTLYWIYRMECGSSDVG